MLSQNLITFATLLSVVNSRIINDVCGISDRSNGLLFGGRNSEVKAWPWFATIYLTPGGEYICGGSLVSSNAVITAAHCIQDKQQIKPRKIDDIIVKLGKHDISKPYERGSVVAYPSQIILHPSWSHVTEKYDSDLAIIILEVPVQFSSMIFPICLWSHETDSSPIVGTLVGYGKSESGLESTPKQLDITIHTNEDCFLNNPRMAIISSKNTFCASRDSRSGPCHGDSGGGLFVKHKSRWFLRGITSVSFINQGQCDIINDAIFTNVFKFTKWIKETVAANLQLPQQFPSKKRPKKEVFCFTSAGSQNRKTIFETEDFDPKLCTILVYIFGGIEGDDLKSLNPQKELREGDESSFRKFTSLKKRFPHLLTLLAVGGWSEGSLKFSQLAADSERRKRFAASSAAFLQNYEFDGMTLFWEVPTERGGAPQDRENLVLLLRDLDEVYDSHNLYLTVAVKTLHYLLHTAYDIRNISQYVDFINLMTFDYTGYWTREVSFSSPLSGKGFNNMEAAVNEFINYGVPAEKLILGLQFHGRTFVTNRTGDIGDPSFDYKEAESFYSRYESFSMSKICELKRQNQWQERYDPVAAQIIGKYKQNGLVYVVTFDSPRSIANKVRFAMEKKLGGVWTGWSGDHDDARGECEPDATTFTDFPNAPKETRKVQNYPLLRAVNEALDLTKYLWKC